MCRHLRQHRREGDCEIWARATAARGSVSIEQMSKPCFRPMKRGVLSLDQLKSADLRIRYRKVYHLVLLRTEINVQPLCCGEVPLIPRTPLAVRCYDQLTSFRDSEA